MLASHSFVLTLFAIILAPKVAARRGGGGGRGGPEIDITLDLSSIDAATFSFFVVFAVFTVLQSLQALGRLKVRRPEEDFPRRVLFVVVMLFTTLLLVADYTLGAILVSQNGGVTLQSLNFLLASSMQGLMFELSHIFLYIALLVLLDYRTGAQTSQYGNQRTKTFALVFRLTVAPLLLIMFSCTLARVIMRTTITFSYTGDSVPVVIQVFNALYHLYLACYILTTIAIIGTSIVLWVNRLPAASPPEMLLFDTHVSNPPPYTASSSLCDTGSPGPRPHFKDHMPHSCHPSNV
jgi:hypothetical protein